MTPEQKKYLYFIQERESIRLKKNAGEPKPWTKDKILQSYRFTCVRRMDDKVSQWLLNNWLKPYYGHKNMVAAIALARHFNLPETLEAIGFPKKWEPKRMKKIIRKLRDDGANTFNSAYMVRGNDGADKIESVIDHTVQQLIDEPPEINTSSIEKSWTELTRYHGFGSFMAGQVIADLRWAVDGTWADKYTWAAVGPGSARGMLRMLGRDYNEGMSQEEFLPHLRDLMEICVKKLPSTITSRLEAIDYQNCCCEVDKYLRVLNDQGRPKSRYPGAYNSQPTLFDEEP